MNTFDESEQKTGKGARIAVAAALTRRANHHPDDLYGVAPGGTTYALASCTN